MDSMVRYKPKGIRNTSETLKEGKRRKRRESTGKGEPVMTFRVNCPIANLDSVIFDVEQVSSLDSASVPSTIKGK